MEKDCVGNVRSRQRDTVSREIDSSKIEARRQRLGGWTASATAQFEDISALWQITHNQAGIARPLVRSLLCSHSGVAFGDLIVALFDDALALHHRQLVLIHISNRDPIPLRGC